MRYKDKGSIHKILVFILVCWTVILGNVFLQIKKAGFVNQYLEDALMQANLAAIVIDPYRYGATGELVFENMNDVKKVFGEILEDSLGTKQRQTDLGIHYIGLQDFRVYEKLQDGIVESVYDEASGWISSKYDSGTEVYAPDGTRIISGSIYAKIKVSVTFLFGIELEIMKEHCADIVSEELMYGQE